MPTKLDLCNTALALLGDDVLPDLTSTKKGRAAALAFHYLRLSLLRSHPWRWATKRAEVAIATGQTPPMGWERAYTLPADLVRLLSVGSDEERTRYLLEGPLMFADAAPPLSIRYVHDAGDSEVALNAWDDAAIAALIAGLQWKLAYVVTNSRTMEDAKAQEYERALVAAKVAQGAETDSPVFGGPSEFLTVRY